MQELPVYISISMMLATILTVYFIYKAANNSKAVLTVILIWLALQSVIALTGFYTVTNSLPPRFLLAVLPPLIFNISLFFFAKGRSFLDSLNIKYLTLLHSVRIPVELILFWLFIYNVIPEIMTIEGRNPDIFSGISALFMFYLVTLKKRIKRLLLAWNIISLGLLINIVCIAILSAPTPFQNYAFDQPNIAVFHFPFIWLPCCIVPLVFLAHLAAIRKLVVQP